MWYIPKDHWDLAAIYNTQVDFFPGPEIRRWGLSMNHSPSKAAPALALRKQSAGTPAGS